MESLPTPLHPSSSLTKLVVAYITCYLLHVCVLRVVYIRVLYNICITFIFELCNK